MVAVGDTVPASLLTYVESLVGAWSDWTPTLTNWTQGSGSITAKRLLLGKLCIYRFMFIYGAGSAVGTSPRFTLPATPRSDQNTLGDAVLTNFGGADYRGWARLVSGATAEVVWHNSTVAATVTASSPFAFGATDIIEVSGIFEVA